MFDGELVLDCRAVFEPCNASKSDERACSDSAGCPPVIVFGLQESSRRKIKRCRTDLLYPPSLSTVLDGELVLDYSAVFELCIAR